MISVLFLYACLASTFTIGKMLLFYLPPLLLTAVRMLIAGTLLLLLYYVFSKNNVSLTRRNVLLLSGLSLVHIFIPYVTEFMALQSLAPSCAALMYNLSPFVTAFFSYVFFNEQMTLRKWIGFGLGFSGLLYFIKPNITCMNYGVIDSSYILIFISVVSSAVAWIFIRYFVKNCSMPITLINGITMILAGFVSLLVSLCTQGAYEIQVLCAMPFQFWILLTLIILIANIIFYNLYGYLLKKYTATFLSFVGFITPLFTAFYDWLLLGIPVSFDFFITIIIIGCGIYLFYQEELKQGYILKANN